MKEYRPAPIDTSRIVLPQELTELTEKIAANVHEVWAQGRIEEGWTRGSIVDSQKKTTPFLIPYDDLPESEKEYDRKTAFETLKLIHLLGFDIVKR